MATVYKIHPAIGIARVGNSPDEFFIGPERVGERPQPNGGFKDGQCRIKRQAARFRIFAHRDDGTVAEVTSAEAAIQWTAHLVNRKAAHPGRNNSETAADLTIDPGTRTLSAPNQRTLFDTGQIKFTGAPVTTVPLGELRTDPDNRLLVLGGAGVAASPAGTTLDSYFWASDDWYDDVSDGPVTATIALLADGSTPPVVGAWVIVAPPKFAPHQDSVITLYDRVLQAMIDGGSVSAPPTTSYTKDVYPILQRARDTAWVDQTLGAHTWADPVMATAVRTTIFNRLKAPGGGGGSMPVINDSGTQDDRLTATQYTHMQRWKDASAAFTNDWTGVPAAQTLVTPDGMDRAALEACVGGAFYPGIEAGGLPGSRPIIDVANYAEPFRLDHAAVTPGTMTYEMALPWQNDFYQCKDNWWPVPRPNYVTRGGVPNQSFIGGVVSGGQGMVDNWHKLGFIVQQGSQHIEVDRCDLASINLLTPVLNFVDVPQGPLGMVREVALAIVFEVSSPSGQVTLQYAPSGAPSHPQLTAFNLSVSAGPTGASGVATVRLWIIYRTSNPGDVLPPVTATVQDSSGTRSWSVTILGNTVARKTAATALVLDRSLSMTEDRGDSVSKHVSLQQAANIFIDVMLEGDGVGIVRFNENAQVLKSVVQLGSGALSDVNRQDAKDIINGSGLDPAGQTSIGDGIFEGRSILSAAPIPYDLKSLVVLTDGVENSSRYIADVSASINEDTYAVGLGKPQNISVPALQTISGNNGGYLLVTGPIGTDNRFLLQKYFLQILAGISNAEIVLDPDGVLVPGHTQRVPFLLTAGDAGVDVILLTPDTKIVDFRVETPSGQLIEPWQALADPSMRFVLSSGVSYYRIALPVEFMANRYDTGGTWHALLTIGRPRVERSDTRDGTDGTIRHAASPEVVSAAPRRGAAARRQSVLFAERTAALQSRSSAPRTLPYSVVVHAYSNVSLSAHVEQSSFAPGARFELHAGLLQSGIPLAHRAQIRVEVTPPSGASFSVVTTEGVDAQFTAQVTSTHPGVYRFRFMARGRTFDNEVFTREKTLTGAVWRGGDRPSDLGIPPGAMVDYLQARDARWCELLNCLVRSGGALGPELDRRLSAYGVDVAHVRKCLADLCLGSHGCG